MKSEQKPLSSGNVVEWNDLYNIFFNIVNIVLILLNAKISAEMLVVMSCRSFEMLSFSVIAVATTALL